LENNSVLNSKASYENESEGCNTVAAAVAATVPPTLSTSHSYIDRLMASIKDSEWSKLVSSEFEKSYMKNICNTLEKQEKSGVTVFPPDHLIFNAFNLTPFDEIRVVLIGQDPYHDIGQVL
jgi:uracil-DNA glycosylase